MFDRSLFVFAVGGVFTETYIEREANGLKYRRLPTSPDSDEGIEFCREMYDATVEFVSFKRYPRYMGMLDSWRLGGNSIRVVNKSKFHGFKREGADLQIGRLPLSDILDRFTVAALHFGRIPI